VRGAASEVDIFRPRLPAAGLRSGCLGARQAHVSIQNGTDEFVLDTLVSLDKIRVLVHELVLTQVWREMVYPRLVKLDFVKKTSMIAYMVFYHEVTVLSLLEAVLYNQEAVECLADAAVDLAEYCQQRLLELNSTIAAGGSVDTGGALDPKEMAELDGQESLEDQIKGLPFELAVKSVSVLRYLTDRVGVLPLSCLTRMLNVHDLPCMLVPLITQPPWTRRTADGQIEKYYETQWHTVDEGERLQLTKSEAQAWLALYNLVQDPECRRKYEYSDFNKNELLKLRGHFNDPLLDQLPLLNELRRTLEELAVMQTPAPEASVVVEQLPEIREQLLKINRKRWQAIAEYQKAKVFCPDEKTVQAQAKRLAETYNLDTLESMLPEEPKCAKCGEPASMRCSRCRNEWYCRRQCQVESWPQHKAICKLICENESE